MPEVDHQSIAAHLEREVMRLQARVEELETELWHERALRGAWQEAAARVLKSTPKTI